MRSEDCTAKTGHCFWKYGREACWKSGRETERKRERDNFTRVVRVRVLFQKPVYQMVSNGTQRVVVLRETNARRARGRFPCVADSAMSYRTTAFRVSVFLGLATIVAAILWLTPPPREYWARVDLGLELCMKTVIVV